MPGTHCQHGSYVAIYILKPFWEQAFCWREALPRSHSLSRGLSTALNTLGGAHNVGWAFRIGRSLLFFFFLHPFLSKDTLKLFHSEVNVCLVRSERKQIQGVVLLLATRCPHCSHPQPKKCFVPSENGQKKKKKNQPGALGCDERCSPQQRDGEIPPVLHLGLR